MQQLIQERNVSFSLLGKAEVLCHTWNRLQNKSIAILQTLINIISQRLATMDLPTTLEHHNVDASRLIFKQTESVESSIKNMHSISELFEKVECDWQRLELESAKHVTKSLTTTKATIQTLPLSTESMIQVTAVSPFQVHDIVTQLAYMYTQEFTYKTVLINNLSLYLSTQEQVQDLLERWQLESRIDPEIQRDLSERIKLYKVVKKVLESVD